MALGKTIAELNDTLTVDELHGWMAFSQLEPFGRYVEDQYHRDNLQLHWTLNSKPGSNVPQFYDRDPLGAFEDEAARIEREERELEAFFNRYEAQRQARETTPPSK